MYRIVFKVDHFVGLETEVVKHGLEIDRVRLVGIVLERKNLIRHIGEPEFHHLLVVGIRKNDFTI